VHAPFDRSKLKLLIIGDSFAEDFVNEIAENGYLGNATISTHWIAAPCGAIITNDDVTQWIPPARRASCVEGGRFEDAQLHALIHEADVVILAAAWRDWQAAYVAGTVGALRTMGAKQVLVVGTKNFGTPAPMRYVGLSDDAKRRLRNPVDDVQAKTNETMRRTLAPSVFIDVQALTCGEDASCPVFTDDLRLISFDGNHLTPDGARYVGRRVFQHPELARIIERASMNSGAESDRTKP
jgi:hypothetical protein